MLVFTADRYLYANPAAEAMTGYSMDELVMMTPWQLTHPDYQQLVRDRIAARLRGESVSDHYEIKIIARGGRERWVELTAARLDTDANEPTGLVTAVDVTDRKLAEEALRESGARLDLAQRAAGIVTWDWNLLTDVMTVSPHAAEVLGCNAADLWKTGRAFRAAVYPEDQELMAEALRLSQQGARDFSVEVRFATPEGMLYWLHHRGRVLRDESGTPVRMIGVAQDINLRKIGEERLRALVEGTSEATGSDFLRSLVRHLAGALGTKFAMICEVVGDDVNRVRPLASWAGEEYGEMAEYDARGTPCENV